MTLTLWTGRKLTIQGKNIKSIKKHKELFYRHTKITTVLGNIHYVKERENVIREMIENEKFQNKFIKETC